MKMAKSGLAAKQRLSGSEGHRFETRRQQELFSSESLFKSTQTHVICVTEYQFMVGCTFALHMIDVTLT